MVKLTRSQWGMLIILALINFFNYLDRQVIFPLFSHIKIDFRLDDFQLGLLATAFMLVHSLASVPLGVMADKYSRKVIIFFGVLFWSATSFASGLAQSFRQLLGIRSLVGVGEASYGPAAAAMISDNFPQAVRARVHGIFYSGMMVGGTVGAMLGGIIAFYFQNWRIAFFIVSIPGIFLALASLWLKDRQVQHRQDFDRFGMLFKNPAYVWILISSTLLSFAAGGYIAWGTEFVRRYKDMNLRDVSILLGITLMVAGTGGVLLGSWIADRWQMRSRWGRSMTIAISSMISGPFIFIGLQNWVKGASFFIYFFIGAAFLSFYNGPLNAVMHDLMPPKVRATAFAVYLLAIHLLGEATAPAVVGLISDRYGLQAGMELLTLVGFLGGIAFLPVALLIQRRKVELIDEYQGESLALQ